LNRGWTKLGYAPLAGAEILEEAMESKCRWRVDKDSTNKSVRISGVSQLGSDYTTEVRLQTDAGTLVGTNGGEWGGGLVLVDSHGSTAKHVLEKNFHNNVLQLLNVKSGVLAVTGLAHLDLDEGVLWLYEKDSTGNWFIRKLANLDEKPFFVSNSGKEILVVDSRGISRLDQTLNARRIASLPLYGVRPTSVAEDAQGRIYLGMNAFVVRLSPSNSGFVQEWYTKPGCLR